MDKKQLENGNSWFMDYDLLQYTLYYKYDKLYIYRFILYIIYIYISDIYIYLIYIYHIYISYI